MRKKFLLFAVFLSAAVINAVSQPCKSDWQYRVPITITNSNSSDLTYFQVKVIIDSYTLINSGKARIDGGDFRFTNSSGSSLSFWIDPSTFNTTQTEFWVKVNFIPASSNSTIYLFYGNPTVAGQSSGDATFELFDDFLGNSLDNSKWGRCGMVSNFNVSGGSVFFRSSAAEPDALIESNLDFRDAVVVEADITSFSYGKTILGMLDESHNGYATTMEYTGTNRLMKLSKITTNTPCFSFANVLPPATDFQNSSGVWSFTWSEPTAQSIEFNNQASSFGYNDNTYQSIFDSSKYIILGSHLNDLMISDSCSVDWIRVRKYSQNPLTYTIGTEQQYPVNPAPTSDGPVCSGQPLHFSSAFYPGVQYVWKKHDNTIFSHSNDTTIISDTSYTGLCKLEAILPGCVDSLVQYTNVVVSLQSVAGTTIGTTEVCSGTNSGIVRVTGYTGNIIRWEMANATSGPWYTISSNNDTITYSNLIQDTYFRPVVKTISCDEAVGSYVKISVNSPTAGGFIIGASPVCQGPNNGDLTLIYYNDSIVHWQYSTDNFATWDTIYSGSTYNYHDLDTTTYFRVLVVSGNCPAIYSTIATVTVNRLPEPNFTAASVCEGEATYFINSSTISSGSISSYQWSFGNSNSSISSDPVYTYPDPGIYLVGLTATSSAGCVASYSAPVTVNPLPNVEFNAIAGCLGTPTIFQAIVTVPFGGSVSSYLWDHDNGTTDNTGSHTYQYPASGMYNVNFIVTSNNGCIDSVSHSVVITSPVNVGFISGNTCLGNYINFINTSSTSIPSAIDYTWDFGNGATSNLINPNYTYSSPGNYIVTLQAQLSGSSSSCVSSIQDTVTVFEVPSPEFTFSNECLIDSVFFYNSTAYSGPTSDLSYLWSFGDAMSGNSTDAAHKYLSPGNYNVTLTSNTINGCSSTKSHQVTIYPMPVANYASADVCLNNNMNFTSTSTVSTGSLSYQWNFGDASTSPVQNPVHLYANDGTYDVTLVATTNFNCTDTIIKQVKVYPLPYIDYLNTPVCDGIPSSFSEQCSINSGSIVSYNWDFGDGSSSNSSVTNHQYSSPGNYNVTLVATSDFGCSNDSSKSVSVTPVPVPNFTSNSACLNTPSQFTNLSSIFDSSPLSYVWSFGNGDSSTLTSPGYIFSSPGIYQVTLIVSSGPGCTDSIMKYAEVYSLPVVNAGPDSSISKGNEIMLNGFMPAGVYYSWTPLSSLSNNSIPNPVARPDETTTYVLAMTDVNGCVNTDSVTITVENDFKLLIYNVVTPDGNGQNDYWEIENIDYYPDANVQIFNRWGEKIYEKTGYANDWQGTYNNDQLPDGSYYYIITFPGSDFNYKGSITLLRNK